MKNKNSNSILVTKIAQSKNDELVADMEGSKLPIKKEHEDNLVYILTDVIKHAVFKKLGTSIGELELEAAYLTYKGDASKLDIGEVDADYNINPSIIDSVMPAFSYALVAMGRDMEIARNTPLSHNAASLVSDGEALVVSGYDLKSVFDKVSDKVLRASASRALQENLVEITQCEVQEYNSSQWSH